MTRNELSVCGSPADIAGRDEDYGLSLAQRANRSVNTQGEKEMMKGISEIVAIMAIVLLVGPVTAAAQQPYRLSEKQMENLLERIEKGADTFRDSLKNALGQSRYDDTRSEDNINQFVKDFESATDQLEGRFNDHRSASANVLEVLSRAASIENFMLRHRLTPRAHNDWAYLRRNLDELAAAYNVAWNWAGLSNRPYRITEDQVKNLLERIEKGADSFRGSLKDAIGKSRFDDTRAEDNINQAVKNFEVATDQLESRFNDDRSASASVEEVLRRAGAIDGFMRRYSHTLTPRAHRDWMDLRRNLDELAQAYGVSWRW